MSHKIHELCSIYQTFQKTPIEYVAQTCILNKAECILFRFVYVLSETTGNAIPHSHGFVKVRNFLKLSNMEFHTCSACVTHQNKH